MDSDEQIKHGRTMTAPSAPDQASVEIRQARTQEKQPSRRGRALSTFWETAKSVWPSAKRAKLPARVARSIERNDHLSEALVKLIQLIVFALWGVFYLAAPRPDPDTISRVPIVISLYLAFTFALLILGLLRRIPDWLVYLSIFLDMALLTFLIWSFHGQYNQPASFSLKTVEVMNFFVLIGLRALRFEARYVIAAGTMAASCWAALVYYTVTIDPIDPMVTRDYVTYITSNSVLIGAEVSKIISMIMFTTILAIAVRRAHGFLVDSIAEGSAAQDLSRFMATSVAEQIRDADQQIQSGDGVRREAAIVNVDIRGFTNMSTRMQPDDVVALLSDYQHRIVPIVHRHNGIIDKFMGDGIMITFGAASPDPQYCANALRCIDEILASATGWQGPTAGLTINMAVAEGTVIYGAVGDGDRLEFTVIGAPVNLSAKLEKLNKTLGSTAVCNRSLWDRARQQGYQPVRQASATRAVVEGSPDPLDLVVLA